MTAVIPLSVLVHDPGVSATQARLGIEQLLNKLYWTLILRMRTASIPKPACHYHNGRRTCFHDITKMPAIEIEFVRLKINALEMLRPLGIAAITVIPLARCYLSHIVTIIQTKKSYRSYQSSSTATSSHGVCH